MLVENIHTSGRRYPTLMQQIAANASQRAGLFRPRDFDADGRAWYPSGAGGPADGAGRATVGGVVGVDVVVILTQFISL